MAPEGETRETEGESASEVAEHTSVGGCGIATPVECVALRACPGRTCPDDALSVGFVVDDFPECFVVSQGVEVVFVESCTTAGVEPTNGSSFAKVALDGANSEVEEMGYVVLVPGDGLGVGEVEDGVFVGHAPFGVADAEPLGNNLWEEGIAWCEVG